jgi:hypothetical protein
MTFARKIEILPLLILSATHSNTRKVVISVHRLNHR